MLRIEAAVHGLSGKPAEAASLDPVKNRRGKLIVLAAGCVLAIAIAVWAVLGRPGAPADDRSAKAALTSKVAVPATTTTTRTTSTTAATTPFTTPVPTTTTDSPPQRQATPSTPRPPQRLSLGSIVLVPTDGLDLDAGTRGYQDDPGMDISPSRDGNLINGMSHGKPKLAVVTSSAATGPGLCATVPAGAWRTPLSGLYQMRVGDRVCVLTDQGNHGVLTLRTVPSAGAVDLDVDYVAWQG